MFSVKAEKNSSFKTKLIFLQLRYGESCYIFLIFCLLQQFLKIITYIFKFDFPFVMSCMISFGIEDVIFSKKRKAKKKFLKNNLQIQKLYPPHILYIKLGPPHKRLYQMTKKHITLKLPTVAKMSN